jgi:hypothetical protein
MVITHQCELCGFERNKKLEPEDDFSALLEIMKSR